MACKLFLTPCFLQTTCVIENLSNRVSLCTTGVPCMNSASENIFTQGCVLVKSSCRLVCRYGNGVVRPLMGGHL